MKKSLKILSALTLLFLITTLSTAQSLTGTVLDQNTKQPLVFATVQVGENYGVITNDEGVFNIQTQRFSENDTIKFSIMGHSSKKFLLKDFNLKTVYLEEKIDELDDVYLVNKNVDPLIVMQRMVENRKINYGMDLFHFQIFSRNSTQYTPLDFGLNLKKADFTDRNSIRTFNSEVQDYANQIRDKTTSKYIDNYSEVYTHNELIKIDEHKTTELINRKKNTSLENLQVKIFNLLGNKLNSDNTFKVNSGLLPVKDSLRFGENNNLFTKKDTLTSPLKDSYKRKLESVDLSKSHTYDFLIDLKKYDYILEKVSGFQDEMVYVISFTPGKRSAKYNGRLYVSADTYAVLKMEYQLADNKSAEKMNLKFLLGYKSDKYFNSGIVIYQKIGDKYFPKYIQSHTNDYTYFDRPFTFRENVPRKNRINIKFDFSLETIIASRQELLILDTRDLTIEEFNSYTEGHKATVETIQKYDPTVWENYNIIAPNEAIRSFEF